MEKDFKLEIVMGIAGCVLSVVIWGFVMHYKRKRANKVLDDLKTGNAAVVKFHEKLSRNKCKPSEVIKGYYNFLLHIHTEYKKFSADKSWKREVFIPIACRKHQIDTVVDLFKRINEYLTFDKDKYLECDSKKQCEDLLRKFKHMITEISKGLMDEKPFLCLELYSNYFEYLLEICSLINEGIKVKNEENSNVLSHVKNIEQLIQKYKPISKEYSGANKKEQEILRKINEKYKEEIVKEIENGKKIWEYTDFIVFDEIIIFAGKFYAEVDAIKHD